MSDHTPAPLKPQLLLFPASLRAQSHQRRMIDYLVHVIGAAAEIDLLASREVALPLFNQDLERDRQILDQITALHHRFRRADGIIVASPEYNGHVSPYLKNTVDWVSRLPRIDPGFRFDNAFRNKPLLLASASTGWSGGVMGLRDAQSIFAHLGCLVSPEQITVSHADHWASDGPFQFEAVFAEQIEQIMDSFLTTVRNLAGAKTNSFDGTAPCHKQNDKIGIGRFSTVYCAAP